MNYRIFLSINRCYLSQFYYPQIWRALRLIIDAGMHFNGMKRSEAIALFKQYAWDEGDTVQKEITRYQAQPGRNTAYMIGQLQFKKARGHVQTKLGEKFNLKDFHYYLLNTGDIPLNYMEERMKKYAACVLNPEEEGCKYLLNLPKNSDVVHDKLQGMHIIDREMLNDDVLAASEEPVEPTTV